MKHIAWKGSLEIETVSPLHIGSGNILDAKMEYNYKAGQIVRLNIEDFLSDPKINFLLKEEFFAGRLKYADQQKIRDRMKVRYKLRSSGRKLGKEVREAIRLAGDRPYLPGSTIKGAIRTAVAWELFKSLDTIKRNLAIECAVMERKDELKARSLENLLFQKGSYQEHLKSIKGDAKADAMKGMVIRDSSPLDKFEYRLYNIFVHHGHRLDQKNDEPLALEAIPPKTIIKLDLFVNQDQLRQDGNYQPKEEAAVIINSPERLAKTLNHFGAKLAEIEQKFYQQAGFPELSDFFKNKSLLPLGFGTGWNAHTLGSLLSPKEIDQARIVFPDGSPPPISRRLAINEQNDPILPIGWVKMKRLEID